MPHNSTETFDPIQAALYWFVVSHGGAVSFRTKRELAHAMNVSEKTLGKLLNDPTRLEPVKYQLSTHNLTIAIE